MRDGPRVERVEGGGGLDALNGKQAAARVGVTLSGGTEPTAPVIVAGHALPARATGRRDGRRLATPQSSDQ